MKLKKTLISPLQALFTSTTPDYLLNFLTGETLEWGADNKELYADGNPAFADAAHIRAKGTWCSGDEADDEWKRWAETCWPFDVDTELEGAKGVLAKCQGFL